MAGVTSLETYPLYRWHEGCRWLYLDQVPTPPINMPCSVCKSVQTFWIGNNYHEGLTLPRNVELEDQVLRVVYRCTGCQRFLYTFLIEFDAHGKRIRKVGQAPPWSIAVDKNLEKSLGSFATDYRKGLVCESQGHGIGAFGYYRRVVEEILDALLGEIVMLLTGDELVRYSNALEQARQSHVAKEKIELVKDLLPSSLRPDGINPLAVLHDALSDGLHTRSDDECLESAESTRGALVYLVMELSTRRAAAQSFNDSMRRLLDKKSQRALNSGPQT